MLKDKEKFYSKRYFLIGVWGLGLDRFYEGDKKGGVLSIIGWSIISFTFLYLKCSGYEYVNGVENYSDYSPNPLFVINLLA